MINWWYNTCYAIYAEYYSKVIDFFLSTFHLCPNPPSVSYTNSSSWLFNSDLPVSPKMVAGISFNIYTLFCLSRRVLIQFHPFNVVLYPSMMFSTQRFPFLSFEPEPSSNGSWISGINSLFVSPHPFVKYFGRKL